jgi:hypothetical protein
VCGNPLEAPEPMSAPVSQPAPAEPVTLSEPAPVEPEVETVIQTPVEAQVPVEEIVEAEPVSAPALEQDVYCPTCGAPVEPGDTFCGNCGASIGEAVIETEIAPIEPVLEEAAGELPAEAAVAEPVPVEEWTPEEILIEEVVVEQVPADEAPAEAAEAVAPVIVESEAVAPEAVEPEVVAPQPAPPQAAPEPEPVPIVEPAGPYLEIVDSGAHIPLVQQPASLMGRVDEVSGIYPDVDLTPHGGEEGGVSRRHAELQYVGGGWFVMDLDSTNGTLLNGSELPPKVPTPLSEGDRLALGELEIVFHA